MNVLKLLVFCRKLTYVFSVMRQTVNGNQSSVLPRTDGEKEETSRKKKHDYPKSTSCVQNKAMAHNFFVVDVPFTSLRALSISSNRVRPYAL